MRLVAAMSGGVDSSVAAALLRDAGHEVVGVFLRSGAWDGPAGGTAARGCCTAGDAADAARVADLLGIPFYSLDFSARFESIVASFARSYAEGRTPNPCVACNRDLKFGHLLRFADSLGAEAVATGHYASVEERDGRFALRVPRDARKDQTYVLFALSQDQLSRTLFPLSGMTKDETRRAAAARGLPVAEKPESMEICFVPGGDYREVLRTRAPEALVGGEVVDARTGGVLGRHGGVGTVTIGQRRGLGVAAGRPLHVVGIDPARNRVLVDGPEGCSRRDVAVEGWNGVAADVPAEGASLRGRAKVRRNHDPVPAVAVGRGAGRADVTFDDPVFAPAPGQALVLYDDGGRVLGGGWIASAAS